VTGTELSAFSGTVATFKDGNASAPASDFTALVNWGDGTPATSGVVTGSGGSYSVSGTHTYGNAGAFPIQVQIVDVGGAHAATTTSANMAFVNGCTIAGEVHADAHFSSATKKDIHFEVEADCDVKKQPDKSLLLYVHHAHVGIHDGPSLVIDAKTDDHNSDVKSIDIRGNTAIIAGTSGGYTFILHLTDGGKGKTAIDTASVVVTDSHGNVVFDSSQVSEPHSPNVTITNEDDGAAD